MRDWDFYNQNTVSRCGTGVLRTDWGCPGAGRSDLKRKRSNNEDIRKNELQIALGAWALLSHD